MTWSGSTSVETRPSANTMPPETTGLGFSVEPKGPEKVVVFCNRNTVNGPIELSAALSPEWVASNPYIAQLQLLSKHAANNTQITTTPARFTRTAGDITRAHQ